MEGVTSAMANNSISEKDNSLKENDMKNGLEKNGGDTSDAGGFGLAPEVVGSNYARMPVEKEALRYNMGHKHRGHCVIFNHRTFDRLTGLGERNGTDRDRDQAQQLFASLGFKVKVYDNQTVERIKEVIQDLAFGTDHSDCDSLVIVFMSHGEQDILYGRDGSFKADYLFDSFNADQCKSLAGKPKLFFIQACRGENLDAGVTLVRTRPTDEIDSGSLAYKIPNTADYLICWSTVPGHFSWRNTTNGSWFMQSLVYVIERQARHDDLLSMMTDINRHMIIHFESNCPSQQHMHGKHNDGTVEVPLAEEEQIRVELPTECEESPSTFDDLNSRKNILCCLMPLRSHRWKAKHPVEKKKPMSKETRRYWKFNRKPEVSVPNRSLHDGKALVGNENGESSSLSRLERFRFWRKFSCCK